MLSQSTSRTLTRRRSTIIGWLIVAVLFASLSTIPWVILAQKSSATPLVLLFVAGWSLCPLLLALFLAFNALCRIEIFCANGMLERRSSLLCLRFVKTYSVDRLILVRQWRYSKNGDVPCDVLYVYSGRSKHHLADELMCKDLPGLLSWIGQATGAEVCDARGRRLTGI